jgi:hypothetical protein
VPYPAWLPLSLLAVNPGRQVSRRNYVSAAVVHGRKAAGKPFKSMKPTTTVAVTHVAFTSDGEWMVTVRRCGSAAVLRVVCSEAPGASASVLQCAIPGGVQPTACDVPHRLSRPRRLKPSSSGTPPPQLRCFR